MVLRFCIVVFILISILAISIHSAELHIIDAKKGDGYGQQWGDRCEGLGDINGDGYGDFLVTEFRDRKLHLYLGGPNPFDYPPVIAWENHAIPGGLRNFRPQNVGDVDCDGINDFISDFSDIDTLKLFLGMEGLDSSDYIVVFTNSISNVPLYVGGGGDNNNDGRPDFWIFNDKGSHNDTIWGYSGCDLLDTIPDFKIVRSRMPDNQYLDLGLNLCTDCDLNGDGIPEIVYGQSTSYSAYPGRMCITWGAENLSTEPDLVFYAPCPHDGNPSFGIDFACLKDISGDGIDDIWISQGGRNYIYFGGQPFDTIPDIGLDWSFVGGDLVENIGDINNDGFNDIMLTMDGDLFSYVAFMYCYPGMDTLVDAVWSDTDYYLALSDGPVFGMGLDHSWLGDIDGDGIDDIMLSPKEASVDYLDHGRIVIQAGWDDPVAVDDGCPNIPVEFELRQNYPNPFNSGTTIDFTLERGGFTELKIYNLLGELIVTLVQAPLPAGEHRVIWDGKDANGNLTPTGMYFYQVISGDFTQTKKMILLK